MDKSTGSIRQRSTNSWELRIYQGVNPDTGKERWSTKTVRGSRRYATSQLREFQEVARHGRIRAGTVGELLRQWSDAASPGWSATTERENKSLIEHHLIPHLGHLAVAKLQTSTTSMVICCAVVAKMNGRSHPEQFNACTLCCAGLSCRRFGGIGSG